MTTMDVSALTMVGVSYRGCVDELRDRLYLTEDQLPSALAALRPPVAEEALIVSTCDRIQLFARFGADTEPAKVIAELLTRHSGLGADLIQPSVERLDGPAAVRHLFRIASSLDSRVVGEPQVLGQVKEAHRVARASGHIGATLEPVLQAAYEAAKRVRTETEVAEGPVSIAAAAEHAARELHGDLGACRAVLLGVGEMGVLLARHLAREGRGGVRTLTVMDRNARRAEVIARDLGSHFEVIAEDESDLPDADILISAVGSGRRTIAPEAVRALLRRRRRKPVLLVDLAVPNDVDPAVGRIDEAFLFDLDALERVALHGKARRDAAAVAGEAIVDAEVEGFLARETEREAVPAIRRLRDRFEAERQRLLSERPGASADELSRLLVGRLLHGPSTELRRMARDGDLDAATETLIERLFGTTSSRTD
jgi:glutamyl-tRNA reductase